MKPAPFDYASPESLDGVLALLRQHGSEAKLLAGGQSLIPLLNFRLARPGVLVDLNRIAELDFIREDVGGDLRIGAMTRQSRLERDPLIAEWAPLLRESVPFIAHEQIRNRGTVGGSLAHADPAAELPALAVTLGARFRLQSEAGERWVAAADFFVGLLTTLLTEGEILTEVSVPRPTAGQGWAFQEVARRHGDYALAGVAAQLSLDPSGVCRDLRLVFLSAGDKPVVAERAAAAVVGQQPGDGAIEAAARVAAEQEVEPTGDIHASAAFKRHLCRVLAGRALRTALARARESHGI